MQHGGLGRRARAYRVPVKSSCMQGMGLRFPLRISSPAQILSNTSMVVGVTIRSICSKDFFQDFRPPACPGK